MMPKVKRLIAAVLSTVLLLSMFVCTANAAFKELQVSRYAQEKGNWCWAAAARMAASYLYSSVPSQSNIVKYVKGSVVDQPASTTETAKALMFATGNRRQTGSTQQGNPWTFQHVKTSIDNHRPLIPLVNASGSGHYYTICGYDGATSKIALIDPGDAKRKTCSWSDFSAGNTSNGWGEPRPHKYTVYFSDWASPGMRIGGNQ